MTAPLPHRSRGVALLTTLLVVALATSAAASLAARQHIQIRRTGNLLDAEQAYRHALGLEAWALGALYADQDEAGVDGAQDAWARPLGPVEVEGGQVSGWVEDLQGRLDLNGLIADGQVSEAAVARLDRLLAGLDVKPGVRQAILDWVDPDAEPRFPDGAEDEVYLRASPPRRAANQPFVSVTELRLVAGIGPEEYERIAPLVTALPEPTPVNLNAAPEPVLMALVKGLTAADAEAFVAERKRQPFPSVEEALRHDAFAGLEVAPEGLAVGSRYFRVHAEARSGRGRARLASLVHRGEDGVPKVLQRERGED
jgi:general secretion pathway protein K